MESIKKTRIDPTAKLYHAVNEKDADELREALNEGADPNSTYEGGYMNGTSEHWPIIFLAAQEWEDKPEILKILLEAGANPNQPIFGDTKRALENNIGETLWSAISWVDSIPDENVPEYIKTLMHYNKEPNLVVEKVNYFKIDKIPLMDYLRDFLSEDDMDEVKAIHAETIDRQMKEERELMGKKKRSIVGHPKTISNTRSSIMLKPSSLRMRAFRATTDRWLTDQKTATNLCHDLGNEMYRDELYRLALDLDLQVNIKTKKSELCRLISNWLIEHVKYD
jgi:hypothetical protein